ncbi:biotin--[acetyl-CoA-carboxylase] ligase [Roseospira visakhapatnamensis]|uniref:biotin--[biotin carboxyl-carrier protein] ligase n=1 Tax=Roseospira visakhapatnamensis TaxID=390880 RepID=A0A7W6RAZ6_9PROT|nr:biotin--[acetyl-CoA-carboxylase] ligase [Roseospira visakhapatnamensis]MBB4265032.1 BirA family biotin operon repressor/biotin-[acetyl-CoA-carboxylase] ligase [Roseospira visakhapatnamensis]
MWRLIALPVVHSTQDVARDALRRGEAKGLRADGALVVWAGEQQGGRGRHGRSWTSPPGNLYVSVALPCPEGPARATDVGFATGVALTRALEDLGFGRRPGLPAPRLKWPNDLLLDGAKVAGLLLESVKDPAGIPWVSMGLGVNVAHCPASTEALYPPTALCHHWTGAGGSPPLEPATVLEPLLGHLADIVARWRREGFDPVRKAWTEHGHGLGEPVRVRVGEQATHGVFLGLGADGALRMRDSEGVDRTVLAGDVFFPSAGG